MTRRLKQAILPLTETPDLRTLHEHSESTGGLPWDTTIVEVQTDRFRGVHRILVSSEAFEPVPLYYEPPQLSMFKVSPIILPPSSAGQE